MYKLRKLVGFDINETNIEITYAAVQSQNKVNVITLKAIYIKVQGDINMIKYYG